MSSFCDMWLLLSDKSLWGVPRLFCLLLQPVGKSRSHELVKQAAKEVGLPNFATQSLKENM
jgi:hypothetical protein